jgi:carboxyl-terminal processing protease
MELFTDVLSIVKKSYVEEVDTKKLIYGAINGMLYTLDPHSSFMTPGIYKELEDDTKGAFCGVGLDMAIKDGTMTVISPFEDTPAFKAGIKPGDQILKIDNKFIKDLTITDAVKKMRGARGTKVTLTIAREGFDKPKEFTLQRENIQVKSVKSKMLDHDYGYVRISMFQEKTDDDLEKALLSLQADHKTLKGLVLDLRNDPGGLLDQAVRVCEHFIVNGKTIVSTKGREENSNHYYISRKGNKESNYPIVVLINGGSASASEIVAGCLQDNKRSIVMGTPSFGKGSVQTVIPLPGKSGLRLTTALYFTPSGRSIQAKGITPDIIVEKAEISTTPGKVAQIREKDLENHFKGDKNKSTDEKEVKPAPYQTDKAIKGDNQVLRALDLLKGWEILKTMRKISKIALP